MNLDKAFRPEAYEARVGEMWERSNLYQPRPGVSGARFSLVIPPPNVTGSLHIGHALDYTLQDIIIRWRRMSGDETLWVPGSDHAGIATQMVVERHLRQQGRSRHEIGREAFVAEVWRWKDQYRQRIFGTLRRLGCSCDWSRERFTLDPGLSTAVRETFVRLYDERLIYRGRRMINWCPSCLTALSDLEVDRDEPETGELWSFAYPIAGGGEIVVATTRPETMLGDTAVAVHPDDPRWQGVVGRRVEHPFFPERSIPIIADPLLADPEFGAGAVKVTPAHDPNDFACGQRHNLEEIPILREDGILNENGGPFAGQDRFDARAAVKAALTERGLFRGVAPHSYAPGRCQRCRTIVEPMVSTQWFLRMAPLAAPAMEAVRDGRIRFAPSSWEKTYFHWLEGIQDWCISRQLWWGHRIPAWYCHDCNELIVSRQTPERCSACGGARLEQDPDVLDTWFSSQLWPFSVFGWPEQTDDLRRFYPTDVLVTGFDIIFFWVARMIMAGLHLTGEVPFRTVLYHGLVRDAQGRKMSKSSGNAVDPDDLIQRHGVDALRFTLAALASPGADLSLSEERLAGYRAFLNKLWNAVRFLLLRAEVAGASPRIDYTAADLDDLDRFVLAGYLDLVDRVDEGMTEFRYDHVCEAIYHFLWHSFCDWSIELSKRDLADGADPRRRAVRLAVLLDVLDGTLRLLHPVAPFITEELWQNLPRRAGDPELLAAAPYPRPGTPGLPSHIDFDRQRAIALVETYAVAPASTIRALRLDAQIPPGKKIPAWIHAELPDAAQAAALFADVVAAVTNSSEVKVFSTPPPDAPAKTHPLETLKVILPLEGAVDLDQERARLTKERDKLEQDLATLRRKLDNPEFVSKAPPAVVAKERDRQAAADARIAEISRLLEALGR